MFPAVAGQQRNNLLCVDHVAAFVVHLSADDLIGADALAAAEMLGISANVAAFVGPEFEWTAVAPDLNALMVAVFESVVIAQVVAVYVVGVFDVSAVTEVSVDVVEVSGAAVAADVGNLSGY